MNEYKTSVGLLLGIDAIKSSYHPLVEFLLETFLLRFGSEETHRHKNYNVSRILSHTQLHFFINYFNYIDFCTYCKYSLALLQNPTRAASRKKTN